MSGTVQLKGGFPVVLNKTTVGTSTPQEWRVDGGEANYLIFNNKGAGATLLSFSAADSAAGVGVSVAGGGTFSAPAEVSSIWTRAAGAHAFEAVFFLRRG